MFLRNCRTAKFGYVLSNDPFCTVRWVSPMTRPKQVPPRPHLLSYWPKTNSLNTTGKCVLLLDFISITFVDCRPAACKQHRQGGPVLYVYTARGWRANVFSFFSFFHVYGVSKNSACRPNGVRWITRWSGWVGEGRTVRATCHRDTNTTTSYSRVQ